MQKDPLNIVQFLAEIAELEKSREVADSLVKLSAQRERLALLEQYLSDYSGFRQDEAVDIESLRTRRGFLSALAEAIGDQNATLEQASAALDRHIETWRTARANSQALGKLTDKRARVRAQVEESRLQREADAHGQRQRR